MSFGNLTIIGVFTAINSLLLLVKAVISYRLIRQLVATRAVLDGKVIIGEAKLDFGLQAQQSHIKEVHTVHTELRELTSFVNTNMNLLGDDITRMGLALKLGQRGMQDGIDAMQKGPDVAQS